MKNELYNKTLEMKDPVEKKKHQDILKIADLADKLRDNANVSYTAPDTEVIKAFV